MYYVYLIQSISNPKEHYVGYSDDLKTRFKDHNEGKSIHTNKFKPWELVCYFAFKNREKAKQFEKYLKTGSGRAFLKKHFLNNLSSKYNVKKISPTTRETPGPSVSHQPPHHLSRGAFD